MGAWKAGQNTPNIANLGGSLLNLLGHLDVVFLRLLDHLQGASLARISEDHFKNTVYVDGPQPNPRNQVPCRQSVTSKARIVTLGETIVVQSKTVFFVLSFAGNI